MMTANAWPAIVDRVQIDLREGRHPRRSRTHTKTPVVGYSRLINSRPYQLTATS